MFYEVKSKAKIQFENKLTGHKNNLSNDIVTKMWRTEKIICQMILFQRCGIQRNN